MEAARDRADGQAVGLAGEGGQRVIGAEDEAGPVDQLQMVAGADRGLGHGHDSGVEDVSAGPPFRMKRLSQ